MEVEAAERLCVKTSETLFLNELQSDFSLSPVEAKVLLDRLTTFREETETDERTDGQIIRYAVEIGEPPGKPIRLCKLVRAKLTPYLSGDLEVSKNFGLHALRKSKLLRLSWEAYEQRGLLTQEDLAELLGVSRATIKRLIAECSREGIEIPTRGQIKDIGRGVSHKTKACELYLMGYTPTEIARKMRHSIESVTRYLEDFSRVLVLLEGGYSITMIRKVAKLSERLVKEYTALSSQLNKGEYKERLAQLKERFASLKKGARR